MGRKTTFRIGDFVGRKQKLEILKIIASNEAGKHVSLLIKCHYCNDEKIMYGGIIKKRNSCGCQQRKSDQWKRKGAKNRTWQLPSGEAARRSLEYQYKNGAKKRKLEYKLTTEEFNKLTKGNCHYCGSEPLSLQKGQGKTSGDYLHNGIDRKSSKIGYEKDNVVSCCKRCNFMKHALFEKDFLNHIKKIYKYQLINLTMETNNVK